MANPFVGLAGVLLGGLVAAADSWRGQPMTEAEWLTSESVNVLIEHLRHTTPAELADVRSRKFRLLACACARLAWADLGGDADRAVVAVAERWADRSATPPEVQAARLSGATGMARKVLMRSPRMAARDVASGLEYSYPAVRTLLRDIFGNPFRPVTCAPLWRTSTALALAEGIYGDRAFDRLPILADALEDAGCDSDDLLAHLRSDGPHVRGCWALDLVIGKTESGRHGQGADAPPRSPTARSRRGDGAGNSDTRGRVDHPASQ